MLKRFLQGTPDGGLVERGKVLIPDILATGMKIKVGDTVVLVATNLDGSVNGKTFVVQGVLDSVTGPGGRDGYINIDDARELLRMSEPEVSEIAIRLKNPQKIAAGRGDPPGARRRDRQAGPAGARGPHLGPAHAVRQHRAQ